MQTRKEAQDLLLHFTTVFNDQIGMHSLQHRQMWQDDSQLWTTAKTQGVELSNGTIKDAEEM